MFVRKCSQKQATFPKEPYRNSTTQLSYSYGTVHRWSTRAKRTGGHFLTTAKYHRATCLTLCFREYISMQISIFLQTFTNRWKSTKTYLIFFILNWKSQNLPKFPFWRARPGKSIPQMEKLYPKKKTQIYLTATPFSLSHSRKRAFRKRSRRAG